MKSSIDIISNFIMDIKEAKKVSKEDFLVELITTRLDKSLDTYITALNKDIQYLQFRNTLKLVRKLNK